MIDSNATLLFPVAIVNRPVLVESEGELREGWAIRVTTSIQ